MKVLGVIPARYASKRFEGKVLASIGGKPLIQHVYENARKAKCLDELLIATDDQRVVQACKKAKIRCMMTSSEHASGTDRLAEVAGNVSADLFVNIQGDEPLVHPNMIEQLVEPFRKDLELKVATLMTKVETKAELESSNVVKVVTDVQGNALYFSRSIIPFDRDVEGAKKDKKENLSIYYRHVGLYAYRRDFLKTFPLLKSSKLEEIEKLEQLRILESGYRIRVVETSHRTIGVDTVEDLERVRRMFDTDKRPDEDLREPTGVKGR